MPTASITIDTLLLNALTLYGEPIGKVRLLSYLNSAKIKTEDGKAYVSDTLTKTLDHLKKNHILTSGTSGYSLDPKYIASKPRYMELALLNAVEEGYFNRLADSYQKHSTAQRYWNGSLSVRSYMEALAGLRFALFSGKPPDLILPWLKSALEDRRYTGVHPFIELCARPFNLTLFNRLHPEAQQVVMANLLMLMTDGLEQDSVHTIRAWAENFTQEHRGQGESLSPILALDLILCGRLAEASNLLPDGVPFFNAAIQLLQGEHATALVHFDIGLKTFRKSVGKRNAVVGELGGYLYVLAMLRSPDARHHQQAETYLSHAGKQTLSVQDHLIFERLRFFRQVQAGLAKPEDAIQFNRWNKTHPLLVKLFTGLMCYWLGLTQLKENRELLIQAYQSAEANGFNWIAAQFAELLHRIGVKGYEERAQILRRQGGFDNLLDWFERQEAWQRQLSALVNLTGNASISSTHLAPESRLIWLLSYSSKSQATTLEPREQKRGLRGQWNKGRPISLKRLHEDTVQFPYLTPQDSLVIKAIHKVRSYYGSDYEININKALVALIGHPAVYWQNAPEHRVELLRGEPELIIKKQGHELTLSLYPVIQESTDFVIQQETPTRLRVVQVTDEHRRIAAILGSSLTVPLQAEQQVLQAISTVAPLITVQSDIGGNTAHMEQVEADHHLHALLLPNQQGLSCQLRVRPFGDVGIYYAPGQGAESVIAEIEGKPLQARRDLAFETAILKRVVETCPVLEQAEFSHEEWQLTDPENCLELLLQLQAQTGMVRVSWPEGEKFKMAAPRLDASRFSLSIKGERDWFAVQGELRLDENRVLDLQKLLALIRQNPGRFIALGDNEFLALTEAFHRRLTELAAFSETQGKTVKINPLAAFALEDLTGGLAQLEVDKQWKQHLQRLKELDSFKAEVPTTLQAELRDYQIEGFRWLSRLAQWGVGACLADDMGLGKTIQLLALLLVRGSAGPAMVVAPTSVCTNWLSEMARFAPTLNPILFGPGDREQTLATLKPFDVLITSYGLLQQEVERFQPIQWHTLILDEAQAIKNSQTLRSDAVMALSADFRVIATGTPLENHLGELWNLFRFINPGLLGTLKQFNERFAGPIERQQDTTARHRLRRLIQPFILRRTKTQVLTELPSRTEIVLKVDLTPEEMTLYEALRRSAVERLENMEGTPVGQRQIQILAEMMKLRRTCCNPMLVAPELNLTSSKLAAFSELLSELLENRHKALVFSQFVDHLTFIRKHLDEKGISYQYLDGATPMQERKKRVDAFQSGTGDVFLISLKAGGTGLNMTAADYVIHMDPWWNPAVEDQASDRAHRYGQQRPVTIYRLVARHTIEEAIVNLHTHKRDLADSLLAGSDVSSRMSAQDMMVLLQEELKL
jgi:SNF2 family DNA or RNA helicase